MAAQPTTAAISDVWEVKMLGKQEDQDCINVWHFIADRADTDVYINLLQALAACVITSLLPGLSPLYRFVGCTGRRISPTLGPVIELFPDSNQTTTGATTGDVLPSFNACCISLHTTRGGKSGRGRKYMPPMPEGSTTASLINVEGAYWLAILAFVACVVQKFVHSDELGSGPQWSVGVWSRGTPARTTAGGVVIPLQAPAFARATNLVPHREIATMRTRKVGRGS